MTLGRVAGTVVSTNKEQRMDGTTLLLIEKVNYTDLSGTGSFTVAMDAVGAGIGEVVLVVTGSSSRQTAVTKDRPTDATVSAIVDTVELNGESVYRKYG